MPASAPVSKPPGRAGRTSIAAELAEHFERGNERARAIPHHQRAAAKALRRSANDEAIDHLRRALDAIGQIADEVERTRIEVELQVAIGAAFMALRGFGAPEVLEAYARAEALCDGLGERADLFPAIWGQWMFRYRPQRDGRIARRLGARLLALAEKFGEAGLKLQAHHAMWSTSFACGELAGARSARRGRPRALRRQDSPGHGVELRQPRRRLLRAQFQRDGAGARGRGRARARQ